MPTFNTIVCEPGAPIACTEALTDYILDCDMRAANSIWDTGIVRNTPRANEFALGCHKAASVKFWLPHDYVEGGIPACSVAGAVDTAPDCPDCVGLEQDTETLFQLYANKCYRMAYCETQCQSAGDDDPIQVITDTIVGPDMVRENTEKLFSQLIGVYSWADALPVAEKDEMILDLGANQLDRCAGIDLNELRDCGSFDAMFVHKDVYTAMRKEGCLANKVCCGDSQLEFAALEDGTAIIPIPRVTGNNYLKDAAGNYISMAFNFGAFEYGEGVHPKPFYHDYDPSANCNDGAESVYYRRQFVLRPLGTEFDTTGLARDYARNEELADGARWNVKIPREFFGLGFVKSVVL